MLADAYIHELGESESAGRDFKKPSADSCELESPARYGGQDSTGTMGLMRIFPALLITLAAATASAQTTIPAPPDVAAPPADAAKTASGLATKVIKPGTGKDHPVKEDLATVDYTGWTTDGKMFDSSQTKGKPATFPVNSVISGFREGLMLMVP